MISKIKMTIRQINRGASAAAFPFFCPVFILIGITAYLVCRFSSKFEAQGFLESITWSIPKPKEMPAPVIGFGIVALLSVTAILTVTAEEEQIPAPKAGVIPEKAIPAPEPKPSAPENAREVAMPPETRPPAKPKPAPKAPDAEPMAKKPVEAIKPARIDIYELPDFQEATVRRIVSGNMLEVDIKDTKQKVLLLCVDSPGKTQDEKAMNTEAMRYIEAEIPAGSVITLQFEEGARNDKYNRLLCYVYMHGGRTAIHNLNLILIMEGYSTYDTSYGRSRNYDGLFKAAQKKAKRLKIGIWGN